MNRAGLARRAALPALRDWPARSITLKLTLAFLGVGLIGALLVAALAGLGTRRAFGQFVVDSERKALIADLAAYYQAHGSWEGVANAVPITSGPPVLLSDADGRVVLGNGRYPPGARVAAALRARAQPITAGEQVVGWLLIDSGPRPPGPGSPERDLLQRITDATTYSAIGATALALLIGIVLARTLTQPIRELTAATEAVAKGDLGRQVAVRSRDELGALAASFNQMSTDLARSSALRRQMTADIAHDLRTPLSVILGYTEALREGKLPPAQEIFDTVHTEAQHLQRLVDDLRTLSLADAGELPLARRPLSPQALLERAAAAHRAQAQAHGIALELTAAADLPLLEVDPERMAQVLSNLLSNALRFTPAGGTIRLAAEQAAGAVQLVVADSGTGIDPADLPHIFERFYRADPSRRQDGSSGLGLAIVKSIVEAHGGRVAVASGPGQGTRFTITLPARAAQDRSRPARRSQSRGLE